MKCSPEILWGQCFMQPFNAWSIYFLQFYAVAVQLYTRVDPAVINRFAAVQTRCYSTLLSCYSVSWLRLCNRKTLFILSSLLFTLRWSSPHFRGSDSIIAKADFGDLWSRPIPIAIHDILFQMQHFRGLVAQSLFLSLSFLSPLPPPFLLKIRSL